MSITGRASMWFVTAMMVAFIGSLIWQHGLGPRAERIDPTGLVSMSGVLAAGALGATKLRPRWAPEIARSVGWVLAAAAWFTAIVADFSTESAGITTATSVTAVLILALTYAVGLRPQSDDVKHEQLVTDIADAVEQRVRRADA